MPHCQSRCSWGTIDDARSMNLCFELRCWPRPLHIVCLNEPGRLDRVDSGKREPGVRVKLLTKQKKLMGFAFSV